MAVATTDAMLSPRAQEIVSAIDDEVLRQQVTDCVAGALVALGALGRIHLPQDDFEEGQTAGGEGDKHLELAPYVLQALASINRLLEFMGSTFPPPANSAEPAMDEFDLEFDLVDGPTGDGEGLGVKAASAALTPREQVAEAANAYGGMLKSRVASLAPRLRHALSQNDSWPLLAELDDYSHALIKSVQGLLFGILAVFSDLARREEILPEYRSAVREAVELRAALADLTYHVNRFNAAIAGATQEQLVPLVVAVSDRLSRFAGRPEYRTLRAEDKKAIIDFRKQLHGLRYRKEGVPVLQLRQAIEGFSKFLEAMQAINHREVLVVHDRQRLLEVDGRLGDLKNLAMLDPDTASARLGTLVKLLGSVYGRNPELDEAIRRSSQGTPLAPTPAEQLAVWTRLVQGTLAVVG